MCFDHQQLVYGFAAQISGQKLYARLFAQLSLPVSRKRTWKLDDVAHVLEVWGPNRRKRSAPKTMIAGDDDPWTASRRASWNRVLGTSSGEVYPTPDVERE